MSNVDERLVSFANTNIHPWLIELLSIRSEQCNEYRVVVGPVPMLPCSPLAKMLSQVASSVSSVPAVFHVLSLDTVPVSLHHSAFP